MRVSLVIVAAALLAAAPVVAADAPGVVVQMNFVDQQGVGAAAGTVTLRDGAFGLEIIPALSGLTPGAHGFHVHDKDSCAAGTQDGKQVPALAAGGHYDPEKAGKHEGPYRAGHLGDLPVLVVEVDGKAKLPTVAPRLKLADVRGRALMIHAGGDTYADEPPLGGGGARIACGVVGK